MSFSETLIANEEYAEIDIVRKFRKYPQFRQQMLRVENQYLSTLNYALYTNLEKEEASKSLSISICSQMMFVSIYGFRLAQQSNDIKRFQFLYIKIIDAELRDNPNRRYVVIYYNSLAQNDNPFYFLKEIYKKLPLFYYAMLQKIYVIEPTFMMRKPTIFETSRLAKILNSRIQFVDTLFQFFTKPQIKDTELLDSLDPLLKMDSELKKIEKSPQKPKIIAPQIINTLLCVNLNQHKFTPDGLPIFVVTLCETLKSRPQYLLIQGIFRRSGSIDDEEWLVQKLNTLKSATVLPQCEEYSGLALAGTLLKFFNKLQTPLFPYEMYNAFVSHQNLTVVEEIDRWKKSILGLPTLNRKVLIYLLVFLKQQVISRQQNNKMTSYNICVCFCPCLFRSKTMTMSDLINIGVLVGRLKILIDNLQDCIQAQPSSPEGQRGSRGSKGSRGSVQPPKSIPSQPK